MQTSLNISGIGITSSLFAAFPRSFMTDHTITGFVRPLVDDSRQFIRDDLENSKAILQSYDGTNAGLVKMLSAAFETNKPDCLLVFATHASLDVLRLCRKHGVASLLIGSGAVTDWSNGRFNIVKLASDPKTKQFAEYIEGKVLAQSLATTTIHPGYYLPTDTCGFTKSGLHIDSASKIFAPNFDDKFNWGKDKFVTPMVSLTEIVQKWVASAPDFKSGVYSFGSDNALPRWKVRELSGYEDIPNEIKEKYPHKNTKRYRDDMEETRRVFDMSMIDLEETCKKAKAWTEEHVLK